MRNKPLTKNGLFIADVCAVIFIVLSVNVYFSRHEDKIRKTYPQKTTNEPIKIVLEKKDQYAIYEIIARKDITAVPELSKILLDQN